MRDEEEFCKGVMDRHLRQVDPAEDPKWSVGQDPPDYVLIWKGTKFHIEVTQLFHEYDNNGHRRIRTLWVKATVERITQKILKSAGDNLTGWYVLTIRPPFNSLKNSESEIIREATEIIQTNNHGHCSEILERQSQAGQHWQFQCIESSSPLRVSLKYSGGYGGWNSDVKQQFSEALQRCVTEKACNEKLFSTNSPLILVILDQYHLAAPEMFAECAQIVADVERFHSVWIVSGETAYQVFGDMLSLLKDPSP